MTKQNKFLKNDYLFQVKTVIQDLLAFLVILNYIIPISLYVTIGLYKFFFFLFLFLF